MWKAAPVGSLLVSLIHNLYHSSSQSTGFTVITPCVTSITTFVPILKPKSSNQEADITTDGASSNQYSLTDDKATIIKHTPIKYEAGRLLKTNSAHTTGKPCYISSSDATSGKGLCQGMEQKKILENFRKIY